MYIGLLILQTMHEGTNSQVTGELDGKRWFVGRAWAHERCHKARNSRLLRNGGADFLHSRFIDSI